MISSASFFNVNVEPSISSSNFPVAGEESEADPNSSGPEPLQWRYDGQKIIITWLNPWRHNEKRHVRVTYTLLTPMGGLYFNRAPLSTPSVCSDNEPERARFWIPCKSREITMQGLIYSLIHFHSLFCYFEIDGLID